MLIFFPFLNKKNCLQGSFSMFLYFLSLIISSWIHGGMRLLNERGWGQRTFCLFSHKINVKLANTLQKMYIIYQMSCPWLQLGLTHQVVQNYFIDPPSAILLLECFKYQKKFPLVLNSHYYYAHKVK